MAGKFSAASVWGPLVDGYNLQPAKAKNLSVKITSLTEKSTGLGDSWEESAPVGVTRGELTVSGGFFDTQTNGAHTALVGVPTTSRVVCFGTSGSTLGESFYAAEAAFESSYDVQATLGELTKATAEYTISGPMRRGVIVQPLAAKTADWNTKTLSQQLDYTTDVGQRVVPITSNTAANPSIVTTSVPHGLATGDIILIAGVSSSSPTINGERTVTVLSTTTFSVPVNVTVSGTGGSFVKANSTGGAVGYLQVTAMSGFSGFVGKLRDSADDSVYADLIVFANVTAGPAAQAVSVSGTIDRYMSFDGDVTGTGSITVFCGVART